MGRLVELVRCGWLVKDIGRVECVGCPLDDIPDVVQVL